MSKAIYVLGLGHSGSTVFGLMMASGGAAIALGEVRTVIQMPVAEARKNKCSCGAFASDCLFWGPALDALSNLESRASLNQRYEVVFDMFDRVFGQGASLIDISKNKQGLAAVLAASGKRTVEPILIAKDVRSYAVSALENIRKKKRGGTLVRRLPEIIFHGWYRRNRDREAAVRQLFDRAPLVITYELLCLNTREAARRISTQLGASFIRHDAAPEAGVSHIISGNRMIFDPSKVSQLSYDYRWFFRNEWVRPYSMMPWVRSYNRHLHAEELGIYDSK